jgi:hypothetical protein
MYKGMTIQIEPKDFVNFPAEILMDLLEFLPI